MIVAAILTSLLSSDGQVETRLEKNGAHVHILRFDDLDGEHEVKLTLGKITEKTKGDERLLSRQLLVDHLVKKNAKSKFIKVWNAKDFVTNCAFDLTFTVFKESIRVSDVNKNGKNEIAFAYVTGCRSDVSPNTMKVLLYEGKNKFALRGFNKVQVGVDEKDQPTFEGGTFQADKNMPADFLTVASALWAEFMGAPTAQ